MYNELFPLAKSPWTFNIDEIPEIAQEELIAVKNDKGIKTEFSLFLDAQFWICRLSDYPALVSSTLRVQSSVFTFPSICNLTLK